MGIVLGQFAQVALDPRADRPWLLLTTRRMDSAWTGSVRYGTDELSGGSSLGLNRIQGAAGGRVGRVSLFVAGVLQGQRSTAPT